MKKILMIFILTIITIGIGTVVVHAEAEIPTISIEGKNYTLSSNDRTPITYSLKIDYSTVKDLTDLKIYYRVNDGEYQEVNYEADKTSCNLIIFGDKFKENDCLQKIQVYAENANGKSEVLEKKILVCYYASKDFNDTTTGISGSLMHYPLGTTVKVEMVNDSNILGKLSQQNLNLNTVYKVTPIVAGKDAGLLLKEYGLGTSTSYILVNLPVPEDVAQTASYTDQIGYVFAPNLTDYKTTSYMNQNPIHFTIPTATYIYNEGYAYYTIATPKTVEKPEENKQPDENKQQEGNNQPEGQEKTNSTEAKEEQDNTKAQNEIPNTGIKSIIIIAVVIISLIAIVSYMRYNKFKEI